jgi:glycosyltransferase involved in cell wall biosynthesis
LRNARLVIVPSRYDGLPNVPLEALALGTRVVATDCPGGIREIASADDEITLVPPEEPKALADGIISALTRPKMDCERPARLDKFSLQNALEQYSALFEI